MEYLLLALIAAAQPGTPSPLTLTCSGGGTATKYSSMRVHSNSQISGLDGSNIVSGNVNGNSSVLIPREEAFADQVDVRLFSGADQIRLPGTTIPTIHGGNGGWFRLKDVVADDRSIRAKAFVNFMNQPTVYIDRVTGAISIHGKSGQYSGECEVVNPNAAQKF